MFAKKSEVIQEKLKLNNHFFLLLVGFLILTLFIIFLIFLLINQNLASSDSANLQAQEFVTTQDEKLNYLASQRLSNFEVVTRDEYNERLILAEIEQEVARVEAFFASYTGGAVMQGYGRIIVEQARACGGDYRVLVGIAGNESGLGRVPYKLYNPYGYLDGVQYESWEHSLTFLSCVISQKFIAPCNADLRCIIRRYGGPETDQEKWIRNVSWFMGQV